MLSQDGRDSRFKRAQRNPLLDDLNPNKLPSINTALAVVSQLPPHLKKGGATLKNPAPAPQHLL